MKKPRKKKKDDEIGESGLMTQYEDSEKGWDVLSNEHGSLILRNTDPKNGFSVRIQINQSGQIMFTSDDAYFKVAGATTVIASRPNKKK